MAHIKMALKLHI